MLLFFVVTNLFAQTSYVPSSATLTKTNSELSVEGSVFMTSYWASYTGEKVQLEDGEYYQHINVDGRYSYGLTDNLQFDFGGRYRFNQSKEVIGSEDYEFSAAGAESVVGGFKYSWERENRYQWAVSAHYRKTLYSNPSYDSTNRDHIVLGDASDEFSFGAHFSYLSDSQNFFAGHVTYRNPGVDLSSEIFSRFEVVLHWKSFSLLGGYENVTSLGHDAYASNPESKPEIGNGATMMWNSVNRSWQAAYLGAGLALGSVWRIEGEVKSIFAGTSTDLGNSAVIRLVRRTHKDTKQAAYKNSFKEYSIEGVVSKVSQKRTGVVINRGAEHGIKQGMKVDFYFFDYEGADELIATGTVVKLSATKSVVQISERYSRKRVQDGTYARAGLVTSQDD